MDFRRPLRGGGATHFGGGLAADVGGVVWGRKPRLLVGFFCVFSFFLFFFVVFFVFFDDLCEHLCEVRSGVLEEACAKNTEECETKEAKSILESKTYRWERFCYMLYSSIFWVLAQEA